MMTLILKIHSQGQPQSYSLNGDGSGDELPSIPYGYRSGSNDIQTTASAELIGDYSDNCEYWLQIGHDPDTIAKVEMGIGQVGDLPSKQKKSDFLWKEKKVFPLFQSTMGRTYLRLFEMAYDEDGVISIVREVISFPIYIIPPKEKENRYIKMIRDLKDTPQFFLDDFRGQMQLNCFSTNWDDGYSSHDDASIELEAVERVLDALQKPLEDICRAPKTKYAFGLRRTCADRIGRCSSRDERRIERLKDLGGGVERVALRSKFVDYDVNAHSAVRHFLRRLVWRCDDILLAFTASCEKLISEIRELKDLYSDNQRDPACAASIHSKQRQIEVFRDKIRRAHCVRARAIDCQNLSVLRSAKRSIRIFDVPRTAFTGSVGYEKAYETILEFERRRFWWVGQKSSFYKTPRLSLANESARESRWARKYSMVYEFWCYQRMLKALTTIGFTCVNGEWLSPEDGSQCVFRRGELEIKIIHGFSAKDKSKADVNSEFWLDPDAMPSKGKDEIVETARERTPDFAIVFKNLSTRKTKWIVADAKSHDRMNLKQIIFKREKYLRFVKHRVDIGCIGFEDAAQSWMIYAGEDESSPCGIECPPLPSEWLKKGEFDPNACDSGYTFTAKEGIVRTKEGDLPRGHLHVNVGSLGTDNSIFEDFFSGEAATMARELC